MKSHPQRAEKQDGHNTSEARIAKDRQTDQRSEQRLHPDQESAKAGVAGDRLNLGVARIERDSPRRLLVVGSVLDARIELLDLLRWRYVGILARLAIEVALTRHES